MGTTPKVNKKPKYNRDDKFRWVDSQWEKFMTEQKELKDKIEKLERKVKKYKLLYKTTRKDLKDIVKRTPSKFLSKQSDYSKPNWTPKQIEYWDKMIKQSIKQTMGKHLSASNQRSDEWRIEQFNRHRAPEEQVSNIQEMNDRVSEIFGEKVNPRDTDGLEVGPFPGQEHTDEDNITWIYESPDGGKTLYRREIGKSNKERIDE